MPHPRTNRSVPATRRKSNSERVHLAYVRGSRTVKEVTLVTGVPIDQCRAITRKLVQEEYLRKMDGKRSTEHGRKLFDMYEPNYHNKSKKKETIQ